MRRDCATDGVAEALVLLKALLLNLEKAYVELIWMSCAVRDGHHLWLASVVVAW